MFLCQAHCSCPVLTYQDGEGNYYIKTCEEHGKQQIIGLGKLPVWQVNAEGMIEFPQKAFAELQNHLTVS